MTPQSPTFDQELQKEGIHLHRDAPPKGERSNKDLIATIVGAARKVESRIVALSERIAHLATENAALVTENARLKEQAWTERVIALDTTEDRKKYLLTGTSD